MHVLVEVRALYVCMCTLPQHALRLIAFGKAHLVLGVDPLPLPGAKREPATAGEKVRPEEGDKTGNETIAEPDAKRPRVAAEGTPE